MSGTPEPAPVAAVRKVCTGCRFHFITYDRQRPYGCALLGFKSHRAPALEVLQASLRECQGYEART